MSDKITLYIPCYNVEQYISYCLEGVFNQTYPIDEVLIIDDGSKDRTVSMAGKYPVKIIKHEANKGLAAARNTGFLNAKNEFVASLDADCEPDKDWIKYLMQNFEDKQVAGVGGKLVEKFDKKIADKWRSVHMAQHWGENKVIMPSFIHGNNNIYKKSVVVAADMYDEKFRTNAEDSDISRKIKELGYKLVYEPKAIVWHYKKDTVLSILKARWRYDGFNTQNNHSLSRIIYEARASLSRSKQHFLYDLQNKRYSLLVMDIFEGIYSGYLSLKYHLLGKR